MPSLASLDLVGGRIIISYTFGIMFQWGRASESRRGSLSTPDMSRSSTIARRRQYRQLVPSERARGGARARGRARGGARGHSPKRWQKPRSRDTLALSNRHPLPLTRIPPPRHLAEFSVAGELTGGEHLDTKPIWRSPEQASDCKQDRIDPV